MARTLLLEIEFRQIKSNLSTPLSKKLARKSIHGISEAFEGSKGISNTSWDVFDAQGAKMKAVGLHNPIIHDFCT